MKRCGDATIVAPPPLCLYMRACASTAPISLGIDGSLLGISNVRDYSFKLCACEYVCVKGKDHGVNLGWLTLLMSCILYLY